MAWGRGIAAGALVVVVGLLAAVPASAHVDAPYRQGTNGLQVDEILKHKPRTTSGWPVTSGYKTAEAELLWETKNGSTSSTKQQAQRTARGLWKARMRSAAMPPLRWMPNIALGASSFAVGWRIGTSLDHWLQLSGPIGIKPAVGPYLSGSAEWQFEPISADYAEDPSTPAECLQTFELYVRGCYVLNMSTVNHGVLADSVTGCSTEWSACVGFTGTQEWADTYATMWAYMQSASVAGVGQIITRTEPCGGDCVRTVRLRVATEADMVGVLYPSAYEPFDPGNPAHQNSIGPTSIPSELPVGNTFYRPYDRTQGLDSIDGEATHDTEEFVNRRLDPGYAPPVSTFSMPDCIGLSEAFCVAQLELAGWTGSLTIGTLTLETANVALPAQAVVTQTYAPGVQLVPGVAITLELNPDADNMPMLLPAPGAHETYTAYLTRLQTLGYVGTATRVDLEPETLDPARGPDEAVRTVPVPGTRIRVDSPVTVLVNPPYAPPPGGGGGGGCDCPDNSLNFGPLTGLNYGSSFPFGIFAMAVGIIGAFNVTPDAPSWTFDLSNEHLSAGDYRVDLEAFDPYMSVIRTLISWVLWIGAIWWFGTRLLGFHSAGDPQEAADEALP